MKTKLDMKSFLGNLLFFAVLLLILARFLSVWSGTPFPLSLIEANSMSPALMQGDVIAWVPSDIEDVKVGDVIVFKSWLSWPDEKYVVHRVVEVTEAWGELALVTKGDANEWIDQSGPHIVEPYVIEKNFVGQTISVGQQPLKIPFVGMIGIWVNDAFKNLAQPTSTKDSMAYLGVFSPLTVSVVILIVSLFIIPEKTRTFKEKLRLYIFGAHKFNIKKVFVTFLIIYVSLLTAIHFFAYDSSTASVGIGEFPEKSSIQFGSLVPGSTSGERNLPVINPGMFPVKGIIFGDGDLASFVNRKTFEVEPGGYNVTAVTATAPNGSLNGSYTGNIMVYSSPIWLMFPDWMLQGINSIGGFIAVPILDILSACTLTVLTIFAMISTEYLSDKYSSLKIDISWQHASRVFLKKGIKYRLIQSKYKIKQFLGKNFRWVIDINLLDIDLKKPILASLVVIPSLFFISSELLATIIASIIAGVVVYSVSCKRRSKIVTASTISLAVAISYIIIKTNYYLFTSEYEIFESMTLGIGMIGIYLLILSIFLLPITLISWYITHLIRNLKERKDPLLVLEGKCDL